MSYKKRAVTIRIAHKHYRLSDGLIDKVKHRVALLPKNIRVKSLILTFLFRIVPTSIKEIFGRHAFPKEMTNMKLGKIQHLVLSNENIQVKLFMLQKSISYILLRTILNAQMNKIRYCISIHIVSI